MVAPAQGLPPSQAQTPTPTPTSTSAAKRRLPAGALIGVVGGGLALALGIIAAVAGFARFGTGTMNLTATGVSMEPTIHSGQTVSATKLDPGTYQPRRGDIVVFTAPTGWLGGDRGQSLVKRVIGLPGERLVCCGPKAQWTIDGTPLAEPYVKASSAAATPYDIVVPEGRLWVMGDNRAASYDSSTMFGMTTDIAAATIPLSAVTGLVTP